MLPFIKLRLADYCKIAFNYCLGLSLPVAKTLWFDRQGIITAGKALHLNLDEFLTARLASLLFKEKVESRLLFFYATIPNRLALSLCSAGQENSFNAFKPAAVMPGCLDMRADFILQTAAPYLLYDGHTVYRLHPLEEPHRTSFYVWDFGDLLGNFLKKVDKTLYFRILNHKAEYHEFSAVPKHPCTHIQYLDSSIPVQHAFCQPLY